MRRYGFRFDELIFDERGNLSLERDPKMVWAMNHPEFFPVEINKASKARLLRVPGIGPTAARRIVRMRRRTRIRSLAQLKATGAVVSRAAPFITVAGKSPARKSLQLSLW